MQLKIENFKQNPAVFMRSCGYAFDRSENNELSFAKRVSNGDFPRYHTYIYLDQDALVINLHVDQKKPSYTGSHAHAGEYDGPLVEKEIERLRSIFLSSTHQT